MQRWMEAKMQRGRVNGFTRSGAGRAMGDVFEDRTIGHDKKPDRGFAPVSDRKPMVIRKANPPKAWKARQRVAY